MTADEKAIRDLVAKWAAATRSGDSATVLSLMSDDVLFMTSGQEPFGKAAFAAASQNMKGFQIDSTSDIAEIKVLGDWAWMRNRLKVTITPPSGKTMIRSGYTLTILRKKADGNWVIERDANMLTAEAKLTP